MIGGEAAARYAKALVGIAEQRGSLDETGRELREVCESVLSNRELRRILENPRFPRAQRVALVEELLKASGSGDLVRGFLRLVVEKDRLAALPGIVAKYQDLADARRGRVRAQVRTAFEMDEPARERLRERLAEVTGREVLMEVECDPNLIGGLVCRVGSMLMDGSIRNQLKSLREQLVAR